MLNSKRPGNWVKLQLWVKSLWWAPYWEKPHQCTSSACVPQWVTDSQELSSMSLVCFPSQWLRMKNDFPSFTFPHPPCSPQEWFCTKARRPINSIIIVHSSFVPDLPLQIHGFWPSALKWLITNPWSCGTLPIVHLDLKGYLLYDRIVLKIRWDNKYESVLANVKCYVNHECHFIMQF